MARLNRNAVTHVSKRVGGVRQLLLCGSFGGQLVWRSQGIIPDRERSSLTLDYRTVMRMYADTSRPGSAEGPAL